MNILLPRFLKSAYRKEPISAFILMVGLVDTAIGGVGQHWSLFSLGLTILLVAAVIRWLQIQKVKTIPVRPSARYLLPPSASSSPLPMLINEKNRR